MEKTQTLNFLHGEVTKSKVQNRSNLFFGNRDVTCNINKEKSPTKYFYYRTKIR